MGFAYVKTVHGVLTILQTILGLAALLAGYMIYNHETSDVYWLFYMGNRPLILLVLVILVLSWLFAMGILLQQILIKDLLEEIGKTKLLLLHAANALVILLAAVIETYYYTGSESKEYYYWRMIAVMVCCWLLLITYIGQFAFVLLQ